MEIIIIIVILLLIKRGNQEIVDPEDIFGYDEDTWEDLF